MEHLEPATVKRDTRGSHASIGNAQNNAQVMVPAIETMVCANAKENGQEWDVTRSSVQRNVVDMGLAVMSVYAPVMKDTMKKIAQRRSVQRIVAARVNATI